MVSKIKNISGEEIQFETFSLSIGEIKDLLWNKTFMTPATFGKMISFFNLEKVVFQNENGEDINHKITTSYFVLDEQGVENEVFDQTPVVKSMLNILYNNL